MEPSQFEDRYESYQKVPGLTQADNVLEAHRSRTNSDLKERGTRQLSVVVSLAS